MLPSDDEDEDEDEDGDINSGGCSSSMERVGTRSLATIIWDIDRFEVSSIDSSQDTEDNNQAAPTVPETISS